MIDLIQLIKSIAAKHPSRIAVIDKERKISYSEFMLLVNSISKNLLSAYSAPKVVFDLEQGVESYALIVAVLNIGGTYCPLNSSAPIEKKRQIINEFSPNVVITTSTEKASELGLNNVTILESLLEDNNAPDVDVAYNGEDIVYVIFTSGSTGVPKGVKICRKALNKFLEWSVPSYAANENDVWGQFSLLSFDLSIVDIFTCLCSGATLYSMNDSMGRTYRPAKEIENAKITVWHSVPSAVEFMIKNCGSTNYDFSSLRLMSFCGEPLKRHQVEFLFSKNPSLTIFNTYGPTEGTLFCTWQELNIKNYLEHFHYTMSIGEAIPGWNLLLNSIEGSEEKEIVIYGDYIGKGYLNRTSDTKFKKTTIGGSEISSFETGDLVTEINGKLYFVGRKDRQVKVKGYRIELDEIDYRVHEFLNLSCVTILNKDSLYCFIETEDVIDEIKLREHLKSVLENYKVPSVFCCVAEIPRNQNQKVDVAELKKRC